MILRTLASGSSGNCILIQSGSTSLLIDAGISCRKITQRLKECGILPEQLSGVLITHEHSDHVAGLQVFCKRHRVPIYASEGTCPVLACRYPAAAPHLMMIPADSYFELGGLTVTAFSTPHDAADSVGYLVSDGTHSAAVATDLGEVTDHVREIITGAELVLLETNHDIIMLQNGPYPYPLQNRILSGVGHLCNEAGAAFAVHLAQNGTQTFILAHLSKENNTEALALEAVRSALESEGLSPIVAAAPRDELSPPYSVGEQVIESAQLTFMDKLC